MKLGQSLLQAQLAYGFENSASAAPAKYNWNESKGAYSNQGLGLVEHVTANEPQEFSGRSRSRAKSTNRNASRARSQYYNNYNEQNYNNDNDNYTKRWNETNNNTGYYSKNTQNTETRSRNMYDVNRRRTSYENNNQMRYPGAASTIGGYTTDRNDNENNDSGRKILSLAEKRALHRNRAYNFDWQKN